MTTMVIGCCFMRSTLPVLYIVAFLWQQWLLGVALCVVRFMSYIVAFLWQQWLLGVALCVVRCLSCSLLRFYDNNGSWVLLCAYYIVCLVPQMLVFTARYELFQGNFSVWSVKCEVSSAWAHGVFVRPDSLAAVLLMFGLHAASSPLITVNELLAVQWALPISEMHTNLWPVLHVWKETSWKVRPVTLLEVLEGSEGIATLSWTSALDRVGYQRHVLPYRRERDPVPTVQEAGWAVVHVWTITDNLAYTVTRSPDRPARCESLYRLKYPGRKCTHASVTFRRLTSTIVDVPHP